MALNNNKKVNIPSIIKNNPLAASVLSKLTADQATGPMNPLTFNIPDIALVNNEKIKNNEDIVRMFPDVELCIQILVSSIISPNDMTSSKLLYKSPDILLPKELKASIMNMIETHIEKYYELNSKLSTILREALFTKGSYIEAIIPEASLDDIISQYDYKGNVSLEHYLNKKIQPTFKYLAGSTKSNSINLSAESMAIFGIDTRVKQTAPGISQKQQEVVISMEDMMVDITDNPKILSINKAMIDNSHKLSREHLYHEANISREDNDTLNLFFRDNNYFNTQEFIQVSTKESASRKSLGRPLVLKLPVESVIPVHVVNDPTKHLGYFVMLDNNGTPISKEQATEQENASTGIVSLVKRDDNGSTLLNKASQALYGMTRQDIQIDKLEELYSKLVENLIKQKLKDGLYGDLVTIKDDADIYRVMLGRALKNQQTKLLFLPSELVAFYAFEYRENGTGKSLLEKASILYSIRSILMFSRLMGSIKNSTTVTEIAATLDEDDPDPEKSKEMIISEVLKTRQNILPLGVLRPDDLADWAHKLGVRFKFQHPSMANLDISTSDVASSKTMPDDELERSIKEAIIMSYGLTPEIVEAGYASDFATTVTAKNLLTAKRVTRTQELFNPLASEHVRKILRNDSEIIEEIKKILDSNKADIKKFINKLKGKDNKDEAEVFKKVKQSEITEFITNIFINEIEAYLPDPQTYEANSSKNAFDDFKTMVEEATDIIFSSESLPDEFVGQLSGKIDMIKSMFRSVLFRKWMLDNNYLPEIADFLTKDEDGKPVFNVLDDYSMFVEALGESFIPFMKSRLKDKVKLDAKLQKVEEQANNSGSSGGGWDDGGSDDSGGDSGGDSGWDDGGDTGDQNAEGGSDDFGSDEGGDFGGGEDFGGGDESGADGNSNNDNGDNSGGGDGDFDGGDFGADGDFGGDFGDEGGGEKKQESAPGTANNHQETKEEKNELDVELKGVRLEKEKYMTLKAKADAKVAADKAGIEFQEYVEEGATPEGQQPTDNAQPQPAEQQPAQPEPTPAPEGQENQQEEQELDGEDNIGGDSKQIVLPRNLYRSIFN